MSPVNERSGAEGRTLRICVLDDYQQAAQRYLPLELLDGLCELELTVFPDAAADADELVARIDDAEVVIAMRERSLFSRDVLDRLDGTRLLVHSGARDAAVDTIAAREHGITVCGTRGKDAAPAELAWALLLAVVRRIPQEHQGIHDGRWGLHVGETLEGKRLGVLGLGDLGTRVARYGQAFGMEVLAHSPSLDVTRAALLNVEAMSLERLLRECDVLSIHVRLNAQTRGMIGERELGLMRRSAVLVNTARAELVDEAALLRALRAGDLAGAGLDVFGAEPLPVDSPWLGLENVVLTPHVGYVSDGRYRDYYGQAVEIIAAWLRGRVIREVR